LTDATYHETKRDRFRDTAEFLRNSPLGFCFDPNVQDYFYAVVHETERFFWVGFGLDSGGHGSREAKMDNWLVIRTGRIMRRSKYQRNQARYGEARPLLDSYSRFCYMTLNSLREDLVYGETHIGSVRHANSNDVAWARRLFMNFIRSLARHEANLRRDGFI